MLDGEQLQKPWAQGLGAPAAVAGGASAVRWRAPAVPRRCRCVVLAMQLGGHVLTQLMSSKRIKGVKNVENLLEKVHSLIFYKTESIAVAKVALDAIGCLGGIT